MSIDFRSQVTSMVDSPGHTVAKNPLLETKLYIPKWRPGLVSRPRLIERMHQGIERKLTLVSVPAGDKSESSNLKRV